MWIAGALEFAYLSKIEDIQERILKCCSEILEEKKMTMKVELNLEGETYPMWFETGKTKVLILNFFFS